MRCPVVGTQRQSFYVAVGTLGEKLVEIGATAPDFAIDPVAVRLRPAVGSWRLALQVHLPASEEKVEVVLAVALRARGRRRIGRWYSRRGDPQPNGKERCDHEGVLGNLRSALMHDVPSMSRVSLNDQLTLGAILRIIGPRRAVTLR